MAVIRILLVDDDEDDFILTRDMLSSDEGDYDYELSWCSSYAEAINAMLKSHYDLYLVDYKLGKYSGIDLLHEAVKSNCGEPIIILTGNGDPSIDREALRTGAAGYLTKDGISTETLTRAIRYALHHRKVIGQLTNSEYKFRVLFERSKHPVVITDARGLIYEANDAALNFLEITHEALMKTNVSKFYRNMNDFRTFRSAMERSGSVQEMKTEFISASGSIKCRSVSAFLQISQHGNQQFFYSVWNKTDTPDLPAQEHQYRMESSHDDGFAELLANEIYNPLSNICLAAEELQNNRDTDEGDALVSLIRKNCDRINRITSSLMKELRGGAGKSKP